MLHPSNSNSYLLRGLALACLIGFTGPSTRADDRPTYREVEFRGREHINLKAIEEATGLKKGAVADTVRARLAVNQIVSLYQELGFDLVLVELVEGGKDGDTRIIMVIKEGPWFLPSQPPPKPPILRPSATLKNPGPKVDPPKLPESKSPELLNAELHQTGNKSKDEGFQLTELKANPILSADGSGVGSLFRPTPPKKEPQFPEELVISIPAAPPSDPIKEATQAIQSDPNSADRYRARAHLFELKGRRFQANADLDEAIRLDPGHSGDHVLRGFNYCHEGHFDRGFADLDRGVSMAGDKAARARAHRYRGAAHEQRRDYSSALADFDRAIELEPGVAYNHLERGRCRYMLGDYDRAIEDLKAAILRKPTAKTWWLLGECCFARGEYSRSEAAFNRAADLDPDSSWYPTSRALARLALGQVDRAIADFNDVIARDRSCIRAFTGRGWAYLAKRDLTKAKADFNKAVDASRCRMWMGFEAGIVSPGRASRIFADRQLAIFEERRRNRPDLYGLVTFFQGDEARTHLKKSPYFAWHFLTRPSASGSAIIIGLIAEYSLESTNKSAVLGSAIVALLQAEWKDAGYYLDFAGAMLCEERAQSSTRPPLSWLVKEILLGD